MLPVVVSGDTNHMIIMLARVIKNDENCAKLMALESLDYVSFISKINISGRHQFCQEKLFPGY